MMAKIRGSSRFWRSRCRKPTGLGSSDLTDRISHIAHAARLLSRGQP